MSLLFYNEEEDNKKEESIDNYEDLFEEYTKNPPTFSESLKHMFINAKASDELANNLVEDIKSKIKNEIIDKNLNKIQEKYHNITEDDIKVISSYTCEAFEPDYSPYRLLNKNLVSDNRKNGLSNVSKYLFILLKTIRKLPRYYPKEKKPKVLYRCISKKVYLNYDLFNKKLIPYIVGKTKTFWGFTSTSPNPKITFDFLEKKGNIKSGTLFTLAGDVWGYDITLFNFFKEEEILLEPERKFEVEEVVPSPNDIISIRCNVKNTPLVLEDYCGEEGNEKKLQLLEVQKFQ